MLSRQELSRGLGVLECVAGAGLLFHGCRSTFASADGMTNIASTFMVASALFAFILPGSLLWLRSPLRWLAQLPLALVLAWLSFSALTHAFGLR